MPAVSEVDACTWPASESRQGRNPRSVVLRRFRALTMEILAMRKLRDGSGSEL